MLRFYFYADPGHIFMLTLAITKMPLLLQYRRADKSLARPERKQAPKHVREARHFNNIETRAVKFPPLQGKTPKEIQGILTERLGCFLPGRAKDLSAPLYFHFKDAERNSRNADRKISLFPSW